LDSQLADLLANDLFEFGGAILMLLGPISERQRAARPPKLCKVRYHMLRLILAMGSVGAAHYGCNPLRRGQQIHGFPDKGAKVTIGVAS
jgi:hypothetical protein